MDESRTSHLYLNISRFSLFTFHWVQGSPLPPAAQAIISLRYFHRHFLDRLLVV
jgi:hypothetical protein